MTGLAGTTLILGGARSGKSRFAESLVSAGEGRALYVATAEPRDDEMAARIARHRARRGPRWITVEAPLDLAGTLARHGRDGLPILVDCLTLWLSNLMLAGHDVERASAGLAEAMAGLPAPVVLVANEVGLGIVPDNALARRFRDAAGLLNQHIAAGAKLVVFVAAGLPLVMKGALPASESP